MKKLKLNFLKLTYNLYIYESIGKYRNGQYQ